MIVDKPMRIILLLQDSLGLRTTYYSDERPRLVASSHLRQVVAHMGSTQVCDSFFATYLVSGHHPANLTPFVGIKRLSWGETIVVGRSQRRSLLPWRPSETPLVSHDPVDQLDVVLNSAIVSAVPAVGNVMCELSGGLDSSTVATYAARRRPDLQAVTFGSASGRAGDDDQYASLVVEHLRIEWHRIDQDDLLVDFTATPWAEPGAERSSALRRAVYELLDLGNFEVLLTGSGGDQAFGSVDILPIHVADHIMRGRVIRAWKEATDWRTTLAAARPETFIVHTYGLKVLRRHLAGRSIAGWREPRVPGWLRPTFLNDNTESRGDRRLPLDLSRPSAQYFWELVLRLAAAEASAQNHACPADIRHPLFYRPLLEFMARIDPSHRRGSRGDRVLHRQLLQGQLCDEVVRRTTKGSNHQLKEEALQRSPQWFDRLTQNPQIAERGWVIEDLWLDTCRKARLGVVEDPEQFNAAVCSEFWLNALTDSGTPVSDTLVEVSETESA
ncbi:MAG: hypothetical protein JOZ93_00315 [Sinobacteraceae bacterium]|nr:hypothetical protein [Nevskiaceae bacterium]